jgi:hypothetical protein
VLAFAGTLWTDAPSPKRRSASHVFKQRASGWPVNQLSKQLIKKPALSSIAHTRIGERRWDGLLPSSRSPRLSCLASRSGAKKAITDGATRPRVCESDWSTRGLPALDKISLVTRFCLQSSPTGRVSPGPEPVDLLGGQVRRKDFAPLRADALANPRSHASGDRASVREAKHGCFSI